VDGACKSWVQCTSATSPTTRSQKSGKPSPRERSPLLEVAIVIGVVALPALPGAIGPPILAIVSMAALASASHPRAIAAFVVNRMGHGVRAPVERMVASVPGRDVLEDSVQDPTRGGAAIRGVSEEVVAIVVAPALVRRALGVVFRVSHPVVAARRGLPSGQGGTVRRHRRARPTIVRWPTDRRGIAVPAPGVLDAPFPWAGRVLEAPDMRVGVRGCARPRVRSAAWRRRWRRRWRRARLTIVRRPADRRGIAVPAPGVLDAPFPWAGRVLEAPDGRVGVRGCARLRVRGAAPQASCRCRSPQACPGLLRGQRHPERQYSERHAGHDAHTTQEASAPCTL
jgi:hypothetical protein